MRPRKQLSPANRGELRTLLHQARTVAEFRRIQCVWLRASLDLPLAQIAQATGLSPASVRCYHSRYLKHGAAALQDRNRGGRHHENLAFEEEQELLRRFFEAGTGGSSCEVGDIHTAYEMLLGRAVPKSTVYRLLARHRWRKLASRPHHRVAVSGRLDQFRRTSPTSS